MNIAIDIDDTISETFETLLPYAQKYTIEELKRQPNIEMKGTYKTHFYMVEMCKWSEEEAIKFWLEHYAQILIDVHCKKYAPEVIKKIKDGGNKIYLVTARWKMPKEDTKQITIDWLKENNIEYDELIVDVQDKLKVLKEKNIDIFIDDSYENCKNVAENSDIKVYMMNSKVNEKLEHEKIQRVYSWPEIDSLIS